jgi:hypothetical protein
MGRGYYMAAGYNVLEVAIWGSEARLYGCHNDVLDVERIVSEYGYGYQEVMRDTQGRLINVLRRMRYLAETARAGDTVVLFFSGHGTQIPLSGSDFEQSGFDQALCVSDGLLSDDRIWSQLLRFKTDVLVIMLVDTCFSGSMARFVNISQEIGEPFRAKVLDPFLTLRYLGENPAWRRQNDEYGVRGAAVSGKVANEAQATIIQLAAGRDTETVLDGRRNGLFTEKLLKHVMVAPSWNDLQRRIAAETAPRGQTPVLTPYGKATARDLERKPLVLA